MTPLAHAPPTRPRARRAVACALACLASATSLAGCSPGEPAAATPVPSATAAIASLPSATASASGAAPVGPDGPAAASGTASAASGSSAVEPGPSAAPVATAEPLEEAPLIGPDGTPLPQTDDRPSAASPQFQRHVELLFRAIVADDPAMAEVVFFPRVAYEQVKDIKKPGADWKHRLMKAFERDVHEYHKLLGKEPDKARLLGLDLKDDKAKWMKRGSEGNKLGYWRITRSKLRYADAAGREKSLEVTSFISWRGEWYLVHLHGYK
ncbi:MAG: hypothetical protein HY908_31275 [Myxococcales bacterium]|nr:hypothetical protein [Myxococcales bacterium]